MCIRVSREPGRAAGFLLNKRPDGTSGLPKARRIPEFSRYTSQEHETENFGRYRYPIIKRKRDESAAVVALS